MKSGRKSQVDEQIFYRQVGSFDKLPKPVELYTVLSQYLLHITATGLSGLSYCCEKSPFEEFTVKTLVIMRHAKSSWKELGLSDHDRPLNKRGRDDAPKMGRLLRNKKLKPELIISSGAKRARETLKHVIEACGYKQEIRISEALYAAGPEAYIKLLRELDDGYDRVMVVGHNPGLEELLEVLTKEEHILPTAALVWVELPIRRWRELDYSVIGELIDLWRPRQLPE